MSYCIKCGTEINEGVKFCPNCGNVVGDVVVIKEDKANELNHVTITPMVEVLAEMMGVEPEMLTETMGGGSDIGLTVVSNDEKSFGASALINESVLNDLSARFGGDFYILPSSTHEIIVAAIDSITAIEATNMVKEVNAAEVAVSDQLGDEAFVYDSKAREIVPALAYEKSKELENKSEKASLIGALKDSNEKAASNTHVSEPRNKEIAI